MAKHAGEKKKSRAHRNLADKYSRAFNDCSCSNEAVNLLVEVLYCLKLGVVMPPYVRYPYELREMVKTFLDVGISPLDVADDLHISHQ